MIFHIMYCMTKGFLVLGVHLVHRAVPAGEDDRSGRWWWEDAIKKECGLHVNLEEGESITTLSKRIVNAFRAIGSG